MFYVGDSSNWPASKYVVANIYKFNIYILQYVTNIMALFETKKCYMVNGKNDLVSLYRVVDECVVSIAIFFLLSSLVYWSFHNLTIFTGINWKHCGKCFLVDLIYFHLKTLVKFEVISYIQAKRNFLHYANSIKKGINNALVKFSNKGSKFDPKYFVSYREKKINCLPETF